MIVRALLFTCLAFGFGILIYANITYDPVNDRVRPLDPKAICERPEKFPAEWSKDCQHGLQIGGGPGG